MWSIIWGQQTQKTLSSFRLCKIREIIWKSKTCRARVGLKKKTIRKIDRNHAAQWFNGVI